MASLEEWKYKRFALWGIMIALARGAIMVSQLLLLFFCTVIAVFAQEDERKLVPPEGLPAVSICAQQNVILEALRGELGPCGFEFSTSENTRLVATREMSGWDVNALMPSMSESDAYFERLPKEEYRFSLTPDKDCIRLIVDATFSWEHAHLMSRKKTKLLTKRKWWRAAIQYELEKLKAGLERDTGSVQK